MNVKTPITCLVAIAGVVFAIPAAVALAALVFIGRNFTFSIQWGGRDRR